MRSITTLAAVISLFVTGVFAGEFVPIRVYQDAQDSPFPDFGLDGRIVIEDFETALPSVAGLTIESKNLSSIREGFSVKSDSGDDSIGLALEASHGSCSASFPRQCPSTVTVEFDETQFGMLPTYAGFVWTDAVRATANSIFPIARINVTDGDGNVTGNLINELPVRSEQADEFADDTLISFVSDGGIRQLEIIVITDGDSNGGHLAIDHVQFGVAALSGDADRDGGVNFDDFMTLAANFGEDNTTWQDADFNFNGETEFDDFVMMARNFGLEIELAQLGTLAVPEPSTAQLSVIALCAAICSIRPRRQST